MTDHATNRNNEFLKTLREEDSKYPRAVGVQVDPQGSSPITNAPVAGTNLHVDSADQSPVDKEA
jgi:hypothetical protein